MNPRLTGLVILIFLIWTLFYINVITKSSAGSRPSTPSPGGQHHWIEEESQPSLAQRSQNNEEENNYRRFLRKQFDASEKSYQEYRRRRREFVGADPAKVNPWPPARVMYFWDYFLPAFSCPYTIQRIGALGDGGKWVCGMELFDTVKTTDEKPEESFPNKDRPCIIYSFGVATESSFEAEFLERTDCEIWAYDASVDRMGNQVTTPHPRVHFNKVYIQPKGNATLGSLMKQNGHQWIDFLKMDIESGEFDVMEQILNEFQILPWGQLHIEIHGDEKGELFPKVYKMWESFEDKGLRPFKNEINHWPCVRARLNPIYNEYSFINTKGPSRLLPNL